MEKYGKQQQSHGDNKQAPRRKSIQVALASIGSSDDGSFVKSLINKFDKNNTNAKLPPFPTKARLSTSSISQRRQSYRNSIHSQVSQQQYQPRMSVSSLPKQSVDFYDDNASEAQDVKSVSFQEVPIIHRHTESTARAPSQDIEDQGVETAAEAEEVQQQEYHENDAVEGTEEVNENTYNGDEGEIQENGDQANEYVEEGDAGSFDNINNNEEVTSIARSESNHFSQQQDEATEEQQYDQGATGEVEEDQQQQEYVNEEQEQNGEIADVTSQVSQAPKLITEVSSHGVSLKWLIKFLETDHIVSTPIKPINGNDLVNRIKELTSERGGSMAEMLVETNPLCVKEVADVCIVYARQCQVSEIRKSFKRLLELETAKGIKDIYVWFDVMSIDHHWFDNSFKFAKEFFNETFYKLVSSIGRTVVFMNSWENVISFKRSWCLWEIYASTINPNTKIEFILLPEEQAHLQAAIQKTPEKIESILNAIDIGESEASDFEEKDLIINEAHALGDGAKEFIFKTRKPIIHFYISVAKIVTKEMDPITKAPVKGNEEALKKLADIYGLLATLSELAGESKMEEEYTKVAIELRKKAFKKDEVDPQKAYNLSKLAISLKGQKKYKDAEPVLVEAISLSREALGAKHLFVAENLNHLSALCRALGRFNDAEKHLREALDIWKESFGEVHETVATGEESLGSLLVAQNKLSEAEQTFQRGLDIASTLFDIDHPLIDSILSNLADIYHKQKNYKEAELVYLELLRNRKARFGEDHPLIAAELYHLGNFMNECKKFEESEACFYESLLIRAVSFGPKHPLSKQSFDALIKVVSFQKKKDVYDHWMKYAKAYGIL